MHEDDAARRGRQRPGRGGLACEGLIRDQARESASLIMVVKVGLVKRGDDLETTVFNAGVIQVDQGGYQVVIGVRKIGEILVPFDRRADPWGLHVELGVVQADIRPDQALDGIEDPRVAAELPKHLVTFTGVVDSSGYGLSIDLFRFELQDGGVAVLYSFGDDGVDGLVQPAQGRCVQQGGQERDTIAPVFLDLLRAQGGIYPLGRGLGFYRIRGRAAQLSLKKASTRSAT